MRFFAGIINCLLIEIIIGTGIYIAWKLFF